MKNDEINLITPDSSREFLEVALEERQTKLLAMQADIEPESRAGLQLETADIMLELNKPGMPEAAWGLAKEAFLIYLESKNWEAAVQSCDTLYRTELPAAITALGNGLWLAITYPIDSEVSILMLNNLIEDTPDKSDGAAVAAAVAHYLADLRLTGEKRNSVMFLTTNLLSKVAERHSNVKDQGQLNFWMDKLELNDPAVFIPRMGQVIDALVNGNWWYDKELLRNELPVN
jgi:hypothetical protein